jgi:hypothetical protein
MDPIIRPMFMGAAGAAGAELFEIGGFYEGGYFAGYISYTANGVPTHALIVAPAASGYNGKSQLVWKTTNTSTPGTASQYDGAANTDNMADPSHPAANYCAGLSIGGHSDWYLPARYELEIAYYNLKPTTYPNDIAGGGNSNIYAVPQRLSGYTYSIPPQTNVTDFQDGGVEAFEPLSSHLSSTEINATSAWSMRFVDGDFSINNKSGSFSYVRAFRKIAL